MIVILLVLIVGMLFGAVLADRLFHAGASSASRRALERLEYTLDGLQTAYSLKVARLDAQRDLAAAAEFTDEDVDGVEDEVEDEVDELVLHLPQRHHSGV